MQNQTSIPPLRVDVNEACAALRISRAFLYKKIGTGELVAVKDGGRTFINVAELHRYVQSCAPTVCTAA